MPFYRIILVSIFVILTLTCGAVAFFAWQPISAARADLQNLVEISPSAEGALQFVFRENNTLETFVPMYYSRIPPARRSGLASAIRGSASCIAFWILFSKSDLLKLFVRVMPFGNGTGLAFGSRSHFNKSPSELTTQEVFFLEIVSRSPGREKSQRQLQLMQNEANKLESHFKNAG